MEKTNTKWDVTAIDGNDLANKLRVLFASGDRPDIVQFGSDSDEVGFVESDLLLPLNQYVEKSDNFQNFVVSGTWDAMKHSDGNIYAIPIQPGGNVDFLPMYRKDWLEKFNLPVPQTIDDYYNFAMKVAKEDPDGNGKDDTYAMGSAGTKSFRGFDHIFSAYGALPSFFHLVDGKIVNGSVLPGSKEALKFINKLYKEGAIDPEFITDNEDRVKEKFTKGVYGALSYYYWVLDQNNESDYHDPFVKNNPNGEWVYTGPIKGASDKPSGFRPNSKRGWLKTAILKDSKHVEGAIRMFDWLMSTEGQMFVNYGVEGEHYEMKDGVVKPTITTDKAKELGITQTYLAQRDATAHWSKELVDAVDFGYSVAEPNPTDGIIVPELNLLKDLNDYTSTKYIEMMTMDGDIGKAFDEFVTEWNKRGGEKLTNALNKAYQDRK